MCRGFAQLGLGAELAHLQCESHHRGNEGNNTIRFGRWATWTVWYRNYRSLLQYTASELAPSSDRVGRCPDTSVHRKIALRDDGNRFGRQ